MDELPNQRQDSAPALAAVIAAVRRDIAAALKDQTPLPEGVRLQADRVVLSLRVAITDGRLVVIEAGREPRQTHTINVEFSVGRQDSDPTAILGASAEGVVNTLMEVFGVPSFDSSARATVFRETIGGISEAQVGTLMESLAAGPSAEVPGELKSARLMIRRLLEKGPAGLQGGARVLREILRQHPLATMLRIIEETWKTPEAWAQ